MEVDWVAKKRHMYPGGNTCYGFYSFYDYIANPDCQQKIVLKGGPGVGKSSFMKDIAADLINNGIDVEYLWCSSDNNSLDGITAGDGLICLLDGTAPHVVDPRFPGAVDWIINLGDFWDADRIAANKQAIVRLTGQIGLCFRRAYNRLKEAQGAWWEWSSYYLQAVDNIAVNRNIIALAEDFIAHAPQNMRPARHLFAAALTPNGIVSRAESLLDQDWRLFAVKGSPGCGVKDLFRHIATMSKLNGIYTELYHCPFDPADMDLILLPDSKTAILDISGHIVDYEKNLPARKFKRMLDFDSLLEREALDANGKGTAVARERFQLGLQDAVGFIQAAKQLHDELEGYYVPAMDFARITEFRQDLTARLLERLKA